MSLDTDSDLAKKLMTITGINQKEIIMYYENPDSVDRIGPYVIVKKMRDADSAVLMTVDTQKTNPFLMCVYLVYGSFLKSALSEITPLKMLSEFMDRFGMLIDTPFGKVKSLIDFEHKIFIEGAIHLDKYRFALKKQ